MALYTAFILAAHGRTGSRRAVQEAQRILQHWRAEDNHARPHGALDGWTPTACAAQHRPWREEAAGVSLTLKPEEKMCFSFSIRPAFS
jgi:transposase InsO family protein